MDCPRLLSRSPICKRHRNKSPFVQSWHKNSRVQLKNYLKNQPLAECEIASVLINDIENGDTLDYDNMPDLRTEIISISSYHLQSSLSLIKKYQPHTNHGNDLCGLRMDVNKEFRFQTAYNNGIVYIRLLFNHFIRQCRHVIIHISM